MRSSVCASLLLTAFFLGPAWQRGADGSARGEVTGDQPSLRVIPADEALAHVGKECTVEFLVASSRMLDGKGACFLNSKKDHRDKGNFTAVIFKAGVDLFNARGIADPAKEYLDKKVRVSGMIEERDGQSQIMVASPSQIAVAPSDDDIKDDAQGR
jgi:DNA/RNA endonuclease YhcR with UshA esterase domain